MKILVVGNITKDVYLNLDTRSENFETDSDHTEWLNLSFNASKHHFFNRSSNFGGAAVSIEVLQKMNLSATASDTNSKTAPSTYRYILLVNDNVTYFTPSEFCSTTFIAPAESVDYLYIDRSASLDHTAIQQIKTYLELSSKTKLVLYLGGDSKHNLSELIPLANLIFLENNRGQSEKPYALTSPDLKSALASVPSEKIIHIAETQLSYLSITENINIERVDVLTHLSAYSIMSATILGGFVLGFSVEDSLKMARANVENAKINSTLSLSELQDIATTYGSENELELLAASLVLDGKGILAADESGGSIQKKFARLDIEDTYDNRRDYRNLFFTTPELEKYVNGVILFDETARQTADDGQNFVNYLTSKCIIPGIKVDQGLAPLNEIRPEIGETTENYTKGLDGLEPRLNEYYQMGLRFAKWRAAFNITLSESGEILTPTDIAIEENCQILAKYALACQSAGLVPIVEPEVVYDGNYSIDKCAKVTAHILDVLFDELKNQNVNLKACLLKVNMIMAGKKQPEKSSPAIVGQTTAEVLRNHVPKDLAGIIFLSGGQTPEQATDNLAEIIKNGPFPWPVTFSFARALQDPALYAWAGNNANAELAKEAFKERLVANTNVLIS